VYFSGKAQLCGLVVVRPGQHPQRGFLHLIQRAVLDVLLNMSQRPVVAKHFFDDRLRMDQVRHSTHLPWIEKTTERAGLLFGLVFNLIMETPQIPANPAVDSRLRSWQIGRTVRSVVGAEAPS